MSDQSRIIASVEANAKELVRTCSELIQINTENPPGDCSKLIEYLKSQYKEIGVEFFTISAKETALRDKSLRYPRDNFVARHGGSKREIGLEIGTHMDVVPPGASDKWRYPPFSGAVSGGKIWGRGACDAKCSLASQLFSMRALWDSGVKLDKSLLCIGTVDDEAPNDATWPGMEFVVSEGLSRLGFGLPEFAINAEASGLENIWGVFRGNLVSKVKFKGRTGHPPVGVNAIEKAISFWEDLISAKNDLRNSRLVWLSGGSYSEFGLTPSEAEMIFRVSIDPRNTPKKVSEDVKKIFSRRREQDPSFKVERLQVLSEQPGFDVGRSSSIVSKIKKAAKLIGIDASYGGGIVGSGDLFHYLVRGIPGVTYGAGALERCHVPNEFVSINELKNQTKIYALTALEICRERNT